MTYNPSALGLLFAVLAIALAGCEVWGVAEYVSSQRVGTYVALGSCISAFVTPALPALADWFWRARMARYSLATWLAFMACLLLVMTAAVQRTGTATDSAEQGREQAERAKRIAQDAAADAKGAYDVAQAAAVRECTDGRKARCLEAENKAEKRRGELSTARAALAGAPAEQSDPLAKRLAAITHLTQEQVRLLYPLLLPIALSVLSALFFAGWAKLDFREITRKACEFEPPAKPTPKPKPVTVAGHLLSHTRPSPGHHIEIERELYGSYRQLCLSAACVPVAPAKFARELAQIAKEADLEIAIDRGKAYLLNCQLAA